MVRRRMGRVMPRRPDAEEGRRRIGKVGEGRQRSTPPPPRHRDCGNVKQTTGGRRGTSTLLLMSS